MRIFLMMKIYAAIALAILGVRLAFETLTPVELVQFFATAIGIAIVGTLLHLFFEYRAHSTGKNAINSPNFLVMMIVLTIVVSGGIYILLTYLYSGEFTLAFDIIFYVLFLPAVMLIAIWLYYRIQEAEYNQRLLELQQKDN